jgi:hypothetical protein
LQPDLPRHCPWSYQPRFAAEREEGKTMTNEARSVGDDELVTRLRESITIGYHSDGYASIGRDKDGNTTYESRPATPMTRLANRDGPEAADRIEALQTRLERYRALLISVEPHLDAIVCYASTMGEHKPNRIANDIRKALGDTHEG